ncbi:uncharacterized protein LOC113562106 [Ooceraea biroi]|uniref:uncharacterized protein LOC113562106 n=1 Tax=Ooceraea biroi TaxID=2015173 RepID=UPI000F092565|nr:uncharacterized protein LOC113562106 [Ooceraea biroi]
MLRCTQLKVRHREEQQTIRQPLTDLRHQHLQIILRCLIGLKVRHSVKYRASVSNPGVRWIEDENIQAWVQRVDKVLQVHQASDGITLLAASSRLKEAKQWYESQTGPALESWIGLRQELVKIFDRNIPFYRAMQRIEARKWLVNKESFDKYAIEKLAMIRRLNLPPNDTIHLLIGGISSSSLRATALSIPANTVEDFMSQMRHITEGYQEAERKSIGAVSQGNKPNKDNICRNCNKKRATPQRV